MEQKSYDLITVLGPTASGKTRFAVQLADRLGAEIISGDSRQVYRRMDLGTGKDLDDYRIGDHSVPYHLIDIAEPGTKYNVFEYQRDFLEAYNDIRRRGRKAVLCGGTGLYIESVLRAYRLSPVPQNPELRERLADKSLEELTALLATYKSLHNTPKIESLTLGVDVSREVRRERISQRLRKRLDEGMCGEVERLLAEGIKPEDLIYYGLEYKYVTLYVTGQITFDEMAAQLELAIHQFAKRQMTWFRGMERRGTPIFWIMLGEDLDETLRLNPGLEERIF